MTEQSLVGEPNQSIPLSIKAEWIVVDRQSKTPTQIRNDAFFGVAMNWTNCGDDKFVRRISFFSISWLKLYKLD